MALDEQERAILAGKSEFSFVFALLLSSILWRRRTTQRRGWTAVLKYKLVWTSFSFNASGYFEQQKLSCAACTVFWIARTLQGRCTNSKNSFKVSRLVRHFQMLRPCVECRSVNSDRTKIGITVGKWNYSFQPIRTLLSYSSIVVGTKRRWATE